MSRVNTAHSIVRGIEQSQHSSQHSERQVRVMFEAVVLPNGDMRVPARAVSEDGETIGDGTKILKKGTPEWKEWYEWWSQEPDSG